MSSTVTKFPQIDHDEARGPLSEIYEDIHSTLRVPWVAFAIRVMSTFPGFVPAAWQAAKPNMSTVCAERCADEIRSAALLPGAGPPNPRARLLEMRWSEERISALNLILDALNYGNPKYLLLITAWEQAFHSRAAGGRVALTAELATSLPRGLPPGVAKLHLVDHEEASDEVRQLWRREIDMHLHHGPASDYRVLAAFPDYLRLALDEVLEPVVRTPAYEETAIRIRAIARRGVADFPSVGGVCRESLESSSSPAEIAGLTGLLFMYTRFIADITIDIIRLKQAFEGPISAGASKFPVSG